jgi:dihydropyrimidinase
MGFLISGGTVVNATGRQRADVLMEGERISAVAPNIPVDGHATIDASGCLIFPGFIDPHTHFDMECGSFSTADDFVSGSRAAILGGTTTVLDFAEPYGTETPEGAFQHWLKKAAHSSCNYGFHMTLPRWGGETARQMEAIVSHGVTSFKVYTTYDLMLDDASLFRVMDTAARFGALVCVHCEDDGMICAATKALETRGETSLAHFAQSRPAESEAAAVSRVLSLAKQAGARVYLVHLSTAGALEEVRLARSRGQLVYAETCPQYLLLTEERYQSEEPETFVMCPPLRTQADCDALWSALADGTIQTVGTDHCSFTRAQKLANGSVIGAVPGGCAGVAQRAQLLYTYGISAGRISPEQFVSLLSSEPARIYGIPDRGRIESGMIADLVVWDPESRTTITHENHLHACDRSPYTGMELVGSARTVFLGGEIVADNGTLLRAGTGQYLART